MATAEVKVTMSPEVAHLFDEAKRERERLQGQVDDVHGAAERLLTALNRESERTHVALSRQTCDAAHELAKVLELQNAADTAIMVKDGTLFVRSPNRTNGKGWRMNLPDALVIGMVDAIAKGRGDDHIKYTQHSHMLTMDAYRADVDRLLKFIESQGFIVAPAAPEQDTP